MKRTLLAIGACLAVTMIYLSVIVSLGLWKGKIGPAGGVIGTALLWLMLYYVWRYVRHGRPANTKPKVDEEGNWIFVLALLLFFGYGFTQLYAGYLGMEKLAGAWWAAGVVVAAVFFQFGLPLSIGAFYGAISIWGWPWWIAFPFVAPGLALNLLMVPGKMARLFNDWKKVDEDTFANPVEGVKPGASASNSASSPSLLKAYERLTEERNQGFTHEALWLKCLSEADGDEERAGHAYNRERAAMLMVEIEPESLPEAPVPDSRPYDARENQPSTSVPLLRPIGIIAGLLTLYFAVLYATRDDRADPRDVLTVLGPQTPVSVVAKPAPTAPPTHPVQVPDMAPQPAVEVKALETAFTNTLGMKFVTVPGTSIIMCIHETRNVDYAAYAAAESSVNAEWRSSAENDLHPVTNVNLNDAESFCKWLTSKEGKAYRLPTDTEWSAAAGHGEATNAEEKTVFPWGSYWPPKPQDGNFRFSELDDGYSSAAPVMQFRPNRLGIYDLGGNVAEWCKKDNEPTQSPGTRGGAWNKGGQSTLSSLYRELENQDVRRVTIGFRCVIEVAGGNRSELTDGTKSQNPERLGREPRQWSPSAQAVAANGLLNRKTGISTRIDSEDTAKEILTLSAEVERIWEERRATSLRHGLDIRREEVLIALTRAKYAELNPNKTALGPVGRDLLSHCKANTSRDAQVIQRVSEWMRNVATAGSRWRAWHANNPGWERPYAEDPRCDSRVMNSWLWMSKEDIVYFWGPPDDSSPTGDDAEMIGFVRDGDLCEIFHLYLGKVIHWKAVRLPK